MANVHMEILSITAHEGNAHSSHSEILHVLESSEKSVARQLRSHSEDCWWNVTWCHQFRKRFAVS